MKFSFTTTNLRETEMLPQDQGNWTFSYRQIEITTNLDGKTLYHVTDHYKRKKNEQI